ncbi:MAG: chemotaxis protein CheW [bacterium]
MKTDNCSDFLIFHLDDQAYGIKLKTVVRTIRSVEVLKIPDAPEKMLGVVNVQGNITFVANIRKCLRLPERDVELSDRFIIARTSSVPLILVTDSISGVVTLTEEEVATGKEIINETEGFVEGVAKLDDGLVLILELERLLDLVDASQLEFTISDAKQISQQEVH